MNRLRLYKRAYRLLEEPIYSGGDCGTFCGKKCCVGEKGWGIYLLPGEDVLVLSNMFRIEKHRRRIYIVPDSVQYLYFAYCNQSCAHSEGMRDRRPLQCRTYPLMPYLTENGHLLFLKNPIGDCPFPMEMLNPQFIKRCFMAWKLLLRIPEVKELLKYDSKFIRLNRPFALGDRQQV